MYSKALYSPKQIQAIMDQAGLVFLKERGQNFLIDGNKIQKIAEAAEVQAEDTLLEIGPGIGAMTQELLKRAGRVIAVEVDKGFVSVLSDLFAEEIESGQLVLLQADALKADLGQILADHRLPGPAKVVSNLPYYISSPMIIKILESRLPIQSVTMMLQKELVDRISAQPSSRDYGALTLFIQMYGDVVPCFPVPKDCFMPRPEVDSAVIRIDLRDKYSPEEICKMNPLIRQTFQQRRKQAAKTIAQATGREKKAVSQALLQLGLKATVRPEEMSLENFHDLMKVLGI